MISDSEQPLTSPQLNWLRAHRAQISLCLATNDMNALKILVGSDQYRLWFVSKPFETAWKQFRELEGESE